MWPRLTAELSPPASASRRYMGFTHALPLWILFKQVLVLFFLGDFILFYFVWEVWGSQNRAQDSLYFTVWLTLAPVSVSQMLGSLACTIQVDVSGIRCFCSIVQLSPLSIPRNSHLEPKLSWSNSSFFPPHTSQPLVTTILLSLGIQIVYTAYKSSHLLFSVVSGLSHLAECCQSPFRL